MASGTMQDTAPMPACQTNTLVHHSGQGPHLGVVQIHLQLRAGSSLLEA